MKHDGKGRKMGNGPMSIHSFLLPVNSYLVLKYEYQRVNEREREKVREEERGKGKEKEKNRESI